MLLKKLKGDLGYITKAANHNKRTHGAASADPALLQRNYALRGPATAKEVTALAKQRMEAAGVRMPLRRDAVVAIEVVCSLPAAMAVDSRAFFEDCVVWVARHFGGEANILSADVHLDEPEANCPHCHVLVLPLVAGKMNGSDLFGSNSHRMALAASFHQEVGIRYGLRRPPPKLSGSAKRVAAQQVRARLTEDGDAALVSAVWPAISDAIARGPEPFMEALGMERQVVVKPLRSFKDIALSIGRGPRTEAGQASRDRKLMASQPWLDNPMGFGSSGRDRTPSCVGFDGSPAINDASYGPQRAESPVDHKRSAVTAEPRRESARLGQQYPANADADAAVVFTRERDGERHASLWDSEQGEFVDLCLQPFRSTRAAAEAWVTDMLKRRPA